MDRLKKQIDFIVEIDKLKHIFRQSVLIGDKRKRIRLNTPGMLE